MTTSLFLNTFSQPRPSQTPLWIMRQAGRYLPEYRAIRSKTTFLGLCKTPELAAEVTLQPIRILKVDAAIIFSDILIVPEAMGLKLSIEEGEGPRLLPVLRTESDLKLIHRPFPEQAYAFLGEALRLVRKNLPSEIPLLGFAGSPWTLLTYMVEGRTSRDFIHTKRLIYQAPTLALQILDRLSDAVADLLNYQIECGAQVVQLFDSWGGVLAPQEFEEFSLQFIRKIIQRLPHSIPIILFSKGTGLHLSELAQLPIQGLSLDWTVPLEWASSIIQNQKVLQGNLDPTVLLSNPAQIQKRVIELLAQVPANQRHIFNLGHGILPETPVDNVLAMIEAVRNFKRENL